MTNWTSESIRAKFLEFFREKGHEIVQSAPIVLKNDPTLMFTNAGMNQFKDYFLGNEEPKFRRAADTQKCLRVSGKHNDLEEVGVDTYHHTMFEMLGNWSFGEYFKQEAISWAWELLTKEYNIDIDRIYVTIFEGSSEDNLEKDFESYEHWKIHISEDRILEGSKKDNFWEMGDTGPCGPSSEIHIDLRLEEERQQVDAKELINKDHPLVIEIWNLVFMEFNRLANGSLQSLPQKHVDTGMGFERLCMVLQGKKSNYDTDVFTPLIHEIEKISGRKYGVSEQVNIAVRVIADHVRAVSFCIADGQLPSNTGAGYVVRRILRRAIRYGYSYLGLNEPFIYKLVAVLQEQMGNQFSELKSQRQLIENVIREEEESFLRTLELGIKRFEQYVQSDPEKIDGKFAFELYDTFGFPIDLTELMAREHSRTVDKRSFEEYLQQQKERSRQATKVDTGDWVELKKMDRVEFVGYDSLETQAHIARYRVVKTKGKELYQIVLDKTPFYAEGGGQVGDTGYLEANGEKISIRDTKKENNLIIHYTDKLPSNPQQTFIARVSESKRLLTENNHSATHLLHAALRQVLGAHVEQKGSLVTADYLRFDFSHFSKVTEEELAQIENIVNQKIRQNIPLDEQRELPFEEAKKLGAMALFGEKYGDKVRVITFDRGFSVELCGGTHVRSTGQIGLFKITSESAIAAGIRRIEAVTALKAEEFVNEHIEVLKNIRQELKNPKDPVKAIDDLLKENTQLKKQLESFQKDRVKSLKIELLGRKREIDGINYIAEKVDIDAGGMKDIAFQLKGQLNNLFLVLGSEAEGKALLTVALSDDLIKEKNLNAGNIIRELAKEIQGGGGGQPFFATAGGKNPAGLERAIREAERFIK